MASDQRAAVERGMRDYAALIVEEVIRRSTAEVGYYGFLPLATALKALPSAAGAARRG